MTDTIDDFWIQAVTEYTGKSFQSITKGAVDLSAFAPEKTETPENDKPETKNNIDHLVKLMAKVLEGSVGDVRPSSRLTTSPVCLVAGDGDVDLRMDRVLKIQQQHDTKSKRVLEVNPTHPLVQSLAAHAANLNDADAATIDSAWLLYDQAKIIQGEPVEDPGAFATRMSSLMLKIAG